MDVVALYQNMIALAELYHDISELCAFLRNKKWELET